MKYGKSAYCELTYTQSKLCENLLFKDLAADKELINYKIDLHTFHSIKSLFEDKLSNLQKEKDLIIVSLNEEIKTLRKINK